MSTTQVTHSPSVRLRRAALDEPTKTLSLSPKVARAQPVKREAAAMPKTETWGRHNSPNAFTLLSTCAIMTLCPILVMLFHLACTSYQGSLPLLAQSFYQEPRQLLGELFPPISAKGVCVGLIWTALQIALWFLVPARTGHGSRTPAGNVLKYPMNGLRIFLVNHVLFFLCSYMGIFKASILYDHRGDLLVLGNIYGILLAAYCYAKAKLKPTHPEDRKFSGNFLYDFYMGIELNPRIGDFDIKLFHNERIGIELWSLFNLSYAAKQIELYGYVSNSMIAVNLLHLLYILDFFVNEDWYLRTIDIAHDHFGWMLAWGDAVWLPFIYTLPGTYLVTSPTQLPTFAFWFILCVGFTGYCIFRGANWERDFFRRTKGKEPIWGQMPQYLVAPYQTTDGQTHTSTLLYSGFWGAARHINYLGDMMMAFTFGISCGFAFIPLFYFFFLSTLLIHRSRRDDTRCRAKYGATWEEYCKLVPWRIVPLVY